MMSRVRVPRMRWLRVNRECCLAVVALVVSGGPIAPGAEGAVRPPAIEYAYTLWDWTRNYRDFARFREHVGQVKAAGFNTVELSVAWKDIQPKGEGKFAWASADRRVSHVLGQGLRLRIRVNFAYAHPWPKWVHPQLAERFDGQRPAVILTAFDERLNALEAAATEAIAARYRGKGIDWCPVFGVHTEHKLSSWLSYEPAARTAFRRWLRQRYGTLARLNAAWGTAFADWPSVEPPIVRPTGRKPDLSARSCDWIAFREESIAAKVAGLLDAVRRGDPEARTSVVLGESYRRGSANMANLAYRPYSLHADRVVFAHDFAWHKSEGPAAAAITTAIMRGITGKPVLFEFGGIGLLERDGYTDAQMVAIGRAALDAGAAGLNMCNYCYTDKPLSAFPHLKTLGGLVAQLNARPPTPRPKPTQLYYVSKWASYCLRDPRSEWVHETQFAPYRALRARGILPRIISDDNLLAEDFGAETRIYVAPPLVIEARAARRLRELGQRIPLVPPDPLTGAAVLER